MKIINETIIRKQNPCSFKKIKNIFTHFHINSLCPNSTKKIYMYKKKNPRVSSQVLSLKLNQLD